MLAASFSSLDTGIGVIECRHGNRNIQDEQKRTLEIVALLVLQDLAHRQDGQDEHDNVEDFKVQVHSLLQAPSDNDRQRRRKERRLQRRAEDVGEGKVHLVVPGFIYRREVLRKLFHERDEDQAHEGVRDVPVLDDGLDLVHEADGEERDQGNGDYEGNDALGHGELVLGRVLAFVGITVLISFEDGIVDAVMRARLEKGVDEVGDNEETGDDA